MKKLLVTCDYPPIPGGQARYFGCLWKNLPEEEFCLLLPSQCRHRTSPPSSPHARFAPIPHGEQSHVRLVRFGVLLISSFLAALRSGAAEVHFGQLVAGGLCGLVLRRILGRRFVVYAHGADVLEFSRNTGSARLMRHILRSASRIVANSRNTAQAVRNAAGGNIDIRVVNPGVEDRFFTADNREVARLRHEYGLKGCPVLVTVARLVERKGHDVVMKALVSVRKAVPDIRYLVVGDGPYRHQLQQLGRELGIENTVRFCGPVPDRQLPAHYHLGDIFVMPSRYLPCRGDIEGFGIVYLEANAAGLPVVAGRSGGVEDAVRQNETGILVEHPHDPEEVARALVGLLTDRKLRERMSSSARAWADEHRCGCMRDIWLKSNQLPCPQT